MSNQKITIISIKEIHHGRKEVGGCTKLVKEKEKNIASV